MLLMDIQMETEMNTTGYDVTEHTWDSAPADLWPMIQQWIIRMRLKVA